MDFAAMKRRDLQALCKRHGLPAGGTNADLVALLDAALPGAAGPEEELAMRKGCLKRSRGNGEAKKVTFALEQEAGASGRKLRSRVIWSPVAAKTTGGHKAGEEAPPEKKVRGRGRPRKLVEVPAAADGVAGEACDDAPATRSRRNVGKSCAVDGVERGNDSSVAEEKAEVVVREAADRKRKHNTQGNAEDIAFGPQDGVTCNAQVGVSRRVTRRSSLPGATVLLPPAAQVGVSRRVTRRSSLSGAAVLLPPAVDRKRGRRNARDGKDEELDAETQAAKGQDFAAAASSVIVESTRSRRKGEVCVPAALRSPKVEESGRTTRSCSIASAVMLPTDVENKRRKTEYVHPDGKPPTVSEVPRNDAPVTRLLRNRVVQVNSSVVDPTVSEVPKNDTSITRCLRNRDVQVNNSVVEPTVLGVPRNDAPVTRSLRNRVVQVNNSVVGPTVSEMPRNDAPVTRSLRNRVVEVNNSVVEETHVSKKLENKRQLSGPATCTHQQFASSLEEEDQEQVASPSKYPPLRRSVRNHSDVSNAIVESNKLIRAPVEDKDLNIAGPLIHHSAKGKYVEKQPSVKECVRRSTRNSVAPTMLEKEKDLIAENKPDAHVRRSMRKSVLPAIDTKDVGDKVQNAKGEDVAKQPAVQEHVRRSTCESVASAMLEKEENDLNAEKNPEAHVRRSMRKSVVPAVDIKAGEIQNGKGKDVEKQPAIKEPVRRSTHKSIVSAVNEEDKDLNAEKNPEANCRKSKRKSVVVAKDIKFVGDAMAEDVEKQPGMKQPVKHSSRKSVLPGTLENEGGLLVVETNAESRASRSKQKCVLANRLDKDSQDHSKVARNEDFQSGKVVGEEKQLKVIEPVRRTRQSVATMVLEKETNGLHEKKLEIPMRRSTRKSVTLNAVEKGGRDDTEMVGREQSPVGTRNLKASGQLTDPAVSITASKNKLQQEVVQDNQGLRRSARKSLEHNLSDDDKTHPCPDKYMPCERMGEGLKRKRRRDSKDISSPANDSWNTEAFGGTKFRKQQNTQSPNEECNVGSGANHEKPQRSQHVSNSTASKGTPAKQRSTTAPEENISVDKTKSDDMVIREATQDGDKVALECSKESNSRDIDQENCQVNATGEELSSAPLHVLLPEETYIVQTVHKVVPESESGDVDKSSENPESSDKCKQVQEHSNTQADDNHACDTRIGGLDESTNIVELVPHTGIVTENETLIDEGEVILGANHIQIVNSGCDVVGLEGLDKSVDIAQEIGSTTAVLILEANTPIDEGTTINAETIKQFDEEVASTISSCCDDTTVTVAKPQFAGQRDNQDASADDVLPIDSTVGGCQEQCPVSHVAGQESNIPEANASESREANLVDVMSTGLRTKDIVPTNSTIKGQEEQYPVSLVAVEKGVSEEANATESAGKTLAGIMLTGLHTKDLHRDYDVLTKETSEASEPALLISDSKQEFHSEVIADESIKDVYTGKCLSKGNSPSTNLHSEGATDDSILPALNAANGCSPNGGCSSFGLRCLVAGECKKSYSRNDENTTVEEVCGNKPSTCVTPKFSVGPDSVLGDEDVQPLGYNADKKLDEDQGIAQEEVSEKKSNDEHVDAIIYPETKLNDEIAGLYMESDHSLAEENIKLVADCPDDKQAMVQAQQSGIQEGTLEKPSLQSATPECKHECVPEEAVLHLMKNKGCLSTAEQSPFGVQCLFSQGSIDECMGYGTPGSATAHIENEDGKLKDCHVKCAKKSPVSEPVSRHDTHEGDCMYSSQQDNGTEGLLKASDEERVFSGPSDANDMGVINSEEVACKGEGNKKLVHSEDLNTSCEKSAISGLGASSEEAVHTMKNYAACLSNPKQLLMELQSLYSKENVEDSSSHDGLASPGPERGGDESTVCHVEQQVSVPLGFNLSRLESTDTLDVSVGCLDTEVLHQGHKDPCNKDKEKQVASRSCTSDIVEAATAKYVESGVAPLPAEISNSKDGQLNPVLEGSKPVQSGLNRDKVVSNILDNGSAASIVGKRTPCGSSLGKGSSTDHYLEQELLDDFCMGKSLEGFAMFGDKSDRRVGTIQNPSFGSTTPDHKPEGALCEEAAHKMENYVGTCSSNPRELLMGLQSLFSEESIEESDRCSGLIFPIAETGGDESTVSRVAKVAETLVSLEHDTYQGPCQDFSRAEDNDDYMCVSLQDNEQEVFLESSHIKERITCTQFDLQENAHHKEWDITPEEVLCEEKEKRKSMPTSDCNINEKSHSNGGDEKASCASETLFCSSQKTTICEGLHLCPSSPHLHQVTSGIQPMPEAAPAKELESMIDLVQAAEKSTLPDTQLSTESEGDKVDNHSLRCEEDTGNILGTRSVISKISRLPKDSYTVYCRELELPNDLSAPKSPEESATCQGGIILGSGICQSSGRKLIEENNSMLSCYTEVLYRDHKEECNERNEDIVTPGVPENHISETASAPVEETSELPDEQLKPKLYGDDSEEHRFSCDKNRKEIFFTGSVMNDLFHLSKDCLMDSGQKQEVPYNLSVLTPEESADYQDERVLGSEPCQASGHQCIQESITKQLTCNIGVLNQDNQECNENSEDQISLGIPASGMSDAAQIGRPEGEIAQAPIAGTSTLPDQPLNSNLEGKVEEYSCKYDKDTCMNLSSEYNLPTDLSAPRSPGVSTIFQNDIALGAGGQASPKAADKRV